jgi:UDP-N-acetylmuramate--alanine ligase
VFQPHRYTRTRDLLDDFGPALALADVVVLTGIYAAGEPPIPGVSLAGLAEAVRRHARDLHVIESMADLPAAVARLARDGDLVVTLGAGSIGTAGDRILDALRAGGTAGTGSAGGSIVAAPAGCTAIAPAFRCRGGAR